MNTSFGIIFAISAQDSTAAERIKAWAVGRLQPCVFEGAREGTFVLAMGQRPDQGLHSSTWQL